ncbi:MAG: hypothetical protein HY352_06090 [Candidatus Omnitrophica bacterium]|nr:hypothetical protein [Candidatus Omnitrophota bacterium]
MSTRHPAPGIHGKHRSGQWLLLSAVCCVLCAGLTGCESFQRKFTRKSKIPKPPPTPIINFEDYTRAMTPLDRYRKHYMLFDYWNTELIDTLAASPLNPKRFKRASTDALEELKTLRTLVSDEIAARLTPLIEERAKIDDRLQREAFSPTLVHGLRHTLEVQQREVRRHFFWRDVQDQLKPQPGTETTTPGS